MCTIAFVFSISGFSPTVFGCSVIESEYHLFPGTRERVRERESGHYSRWDHAALSNIVAMPPSYPPRLFVNERVAQPCTRSIFHVPFPDVVSGNQRLIDPPFRPNLTSSTGARNRGEIEVPFLNLDASIHLYRLKYIYICVHFDAYCRR